jgi:uncharacterized membrane protein
MMIKKTLLKTLSYAAMHMSIAISVAFVLSGSWKVALAIGLTEPCLQIIAYFFHERVWHRIEHKGQLPHQMDGVIGSVSPATDAIEKILGHKH